MRVFVVIILSTLHVYIILKSSKYPKRQKPTFHSGYFLVNKFLILSHYSILITLQGIWNNIILFNELYDHLLLYIIYLCGDNMAYYL